ncbi:serine/threonine-protein kinase [Stigmatella aurantiaca]|uniref:Serine/threonine-protein kinase n=1 Tax=Stigmatella aurantiaca (strain DW4/3-1) TaxID=378806 RepID=E3FVH8_STIAD|nr:serine/threonine-protein kinase [Stigmatella aurantiaca]ADO71004.1 Serine/threonine-protein kinase [Stigmatella aurantiaca DW4/3-1]
MKIGRYEIVRKLAMGGMAEVFLAKVAGPLGFEKTLVLKRILPHLADEPTFVEMFLSEAKLVAHLTHPNIVQIFDFGEADNAYFLAMEYIDGPNLRTLIKRAIAMEQPLHPAICAKIVAAACEGLAYAHDFRDPNTQQPMGLIHRDISPDNIMLSRQGAVKVADFGIAKAAGYGPQTQEGVLKGKLAYMAPEQLKAAPLDRRADVYALGIVLYELLTRCKPFEATTDASLMRAILFEEFVPAQERRPDLPEPLQKILARAVARERDERYPDCFALQTDLERFVLSTGEPLSSFSVSRLITQLGLEPQEIEPSKREDRTLHTNALRTILNPGDDDASPTLPTTPTPVGLLRPEEKTARLSKTGREGTSPGAEASRTAPSSTSGVTPAGRPKPTPPPLSRAELDDTAQFEASLRSSVRRRQWMLPTLLVLVLVGGGGHYLWSHNALPFLAPTSAEAAVPSETDAPAEETLAAAAEPALPLAPNPSDPQLFPSPQPIEAHEEPPSNAKRARAPEPPPSPGQENPPPSPTPSEPEKGLVDFRLASATRVLLNGHEVGVTPFLPLEIPEGRHTVRFINAELAKDVTRVISVKAGKTYVLRYNLNKN